MSVFEGAGVALITPMKENREVNYEKLEEILEPVVAQLEAEHFALADDVAKVSIVGAGMITNLGVAAKMFKCLYDNGFNIDMISTSEIKVSCILQKEGAKDAVRALHDSFGL